MELAWYWYILITCGVLLSWWVPGTILHEAWHALGVVVADARLKEFKPYPHKRANGKWVWGSMSYNSTSVSASQRAKIYVAPILANLIQIVLFFVLNAAISDPITSCVLLGLFLANAIDMGNNVLRVLPAQDLFGSSDFVRWLWWSNKMLATGKILAVAWLVMTSMILAFTIAFFLWG